jgi:hypothetical protein
MGAALDHDAVCVVAGSLYVVDVVTGDLVVCGIGRNDDVMVATVVYLVRAQDVVAAANGDAIVKGTGVVYLEALQDAVVGVQFDCGMPAVGVSDADVVVLEWAECDSVCVEVEGVFVVDAGSRYASGDA